MPVDLSKLNDLAVLTNVPLQEAGPLPASNIFLYIKGALNTLSKTRIAVAEFDTQSHWRRRDPTTNTTLLNIELPRFTLTPDVTHKMVGSRVHVDASLSWDQPYEFGRYKTGRSETGMLWHYRNNHHGTVLKLPYVYWIDGVSRHDERFYQLFW